MKKVIVIAGTTASGKTKLGVDLAKKFNGEIISADSRQVYKGMDIGTGKDLDEYGDVKYHLIDIVSPKSDFSVADWQKKAYKAIDDILSRGKLPIVVGGTGLYISALVEGYKLSPVKQNKELRKKLNKKSLEDLVKLLKKIDPVIFKVIDLHNRRRVQRAIEIYYETGKPKSEQLKKQKPKYDFLVLGLTYPREVLNKRIDKRLKQRIDKEKMIEEVADLHKKGVSWKKLFAFGLEYRYVSLYLQKKITKQEMVDDLSKAIKNFAKRQITWFKRDKNIIWIKDKKQAIDKIKKHLG